MKKRIIMTVVTLFAFGFLLFSGRAGQMQKENPGKAQNYETQKAKTYLVSEKESDKGFLLTLEDETICAYAYDDEKRELVKKCPAPLFAMTKAQKDELKEGIYVQSYEDMCMVLESYLS